MTVSTLRPLGLVHRISDIATDLHLRRYKLKAGRMASRKIPMLPRYYCSTVAPNKLAVLAPETTLPGHANTTSKSSAGTLPTPFSPRHRGPMTVPITTTGSLWHDDPHMGDPCTVNGLDHVLSCGHKVVTTSTEPCAINCFIRSPPDLEQPRDLDQPFCCTACIVDHLAARHAARCEAYVGELVARLADANVERDGEWIEEKLSFVALAWRDEDVAEIKTLCARGKACTAPWIEPEFREVVDIASKERQLGRRSSRSTVVEITRPSSPTPSVMSIASKAPSMFSWHGGLPFGR